MKRLINCSLVILGLLSVQAVVWTPEILHFRITTPALKQTEISDFLGAQTPAASAAIQRVDFGLIGDVSDAETLRIADQILTGTLAFPRFPLQTVDWPFQESHLHLGGASFQLKMAGLAWAEVMLDAWKLTNNSKYLEFAKENVLRFMRFEERQILPTGYLWNDHAVANRAVVYSRLWFAIAEQGDVDRETAEMFLVSVLRTGGLLGKRSHYTYRTNHGLMQNIGLLVLASAFPNLESSRSFMQTAYSRLTRQMRYYISHSGIILEHSSGYHEFGVILLQSCFELLEHLSLSIPDDWREKLSKAEKWLVVLSRPDYTIPNFGNSQPSLSNAGRAIVDRVVDPQRPEEKIHDLHSDRQTHVAGAGYAVFRHGLERNDFSGTHVTAVWSDFISGAHKHADELGLHYWSRGVDWWTSSGYWPYGARFREFAVGWPGSNAPHYVGELFDSSRSSKLLTVGESGRHAMWLLRRSNDDGYSVTRQVILNGDSWSLVIDTVTDEKSRPTEIIWGAPPSVMIRSNSDGSWVSSSSESGEFLGVSIDAVSAIDIELLRGSFEPFGGWMASRNQVMPAPALRIVSRENNSVVTAWGQIQDRTSAVALQINSWESESNWSLRLKLGRDSYAISRDEEMLTSSRNADAAVVLELGASILDQTLTLETKAYEAELESTVVYRDYFPWRLKVGWYAFCLYTVFLVIVLFLPKNVTSRLFPYTSSVIATGSMLLGMYLGLVYFTV